MLKLPNKLAAILFYSSIIIISSLSLFLIFTSQKIALINQSLASELNSVNYVHAASAQAIDPEEAAAQNLMDCDCEKTFAGERDLVISGQVIAAFVSGVDLGVKNLDQTGEYRKFYIDAGGKYQGGIGGRVKIQGRLIGLTCAYANSVFHECVPEVEASRIEELK